MAEDLFDFTGVEEEVEVQASNEDLFDFSAEPVSEEQLPPSQQDVSFGDRMARGVDTLQATLGSAYIAGGEILGNEGMQRTGEEFRARQLAEADTEAPAPEGILEGLQEAVPTIGGILASGGLGLALGGPVGGLVGIGLGSFGVNLGTVKDIQESLDPESEAGLTTFLGAGAATALDIASGGIIGRGVTLPIKEAAKKSLLKEAAKGTAIGAGTGAATQATLETAGTIAADAEFDEERVDAIAQNTALATAVGGALGGTASGAVAGLNRLRAVQDELDQRQKPRIRLDKDGNVVSYTRPPNPIVYEEPGLVKKGIVKLAGRAISPIVHLRKYPAISDLLDRIDQSRVERKTAKTNSYSNEAELIKGENRSSIEQLNLLDKEQQAVLGREIATGTATSKLAVDIKGMLKKIRQEAVDAGIVVGDLGETYLPFSPSLKKIKGNMDGFKAEVMKDVSTKLSGKKLKAFEKKLDKYTENLVTEGGRTFVGNTLDQLPVTKLLADMETGSKKERTAAIRRASNVSKGKDRLTVNKANPLEMERFLKDVDQALLEKWAVDSPLANRLNDYLNLSSERIAFARLFGANGEKIHQKILEGAVEAKKNGESIKISDVERIYNITNAIQRKYRKDSLSPEARSLTDKVRAFQYLRTLPLATIASLVEPFLIVEGIGAKASMTGLGQAIRDTAGRIGKKIVGSKTIGKDKQFADDVNVSYMQALSDTAMRMDSDAVSLSKMEAGLFKWNGLAAWTEFNRLMAAHSAENAIMRTLQKIAKGTDSPREMNRSFRKIEEAGIDVGTAINWFREGASNTSPAYREIRKGIVNLVNDVVVKPDATNRPLWHSDPRLQLVSQLKGWPTVFTTKVMTRWANKILDNGMVNSFEEAAKLATFFSIYLAGLTTQNAIKDIAKDGEYNMDEKDMADNVAATVSQIGGLGFVIDPVRGQTFGSSATAALLGPTVSQAEQMLKEIGGLLFGEKSPVDAVAGIAASNIPNIPGQGIIKEVIKEAF